jgi:23S rRNA A2030 N6-methylase RlmJ
MAEPAYDHSTMIGNEGDVVKHVALLAALDAILRSWEGETFRYADTFAGYAQNILGEGGGWRAGVGEVAGREALADNPHTDRWRRWYLPRPRLRGTAYPGSSLIAADVARRHGVTLDLALWDISDAVVRNLRATWGDQARIHHRPAAPDEPDVRDADFLFVDPPTLETWTEILPALSPARRGGTLVWLPVLRARDPYEGAAYVDALAQAREIGCAVDRVTWDAPGRTVGCDLLHRLPEAAARELGEAVRHVARVGDWHLDSHA